MISKGNDAKFARFGACRHRKKQKHDFQVCFVDRARHRKNSWRQGLTKQNVYEGGKAAVCWLREIEKTERTWSIFTCLEINYQFNLLPWSFFFVQCNIRFGFIDIQNNQGLGKGYQPPPLPCEHTFLSCMAFGVHGSVNSKRAHPPSGHLSSCRSVTSRYR